MHVETNTQQTPNQHVPWCLLSHRLHHMAALPNLRLCPMPLLADIMPLGDLCCEGLIEYCEHAQRYVHHGSVLGGGGPSSTNVKGCTKPPSEAWVLEYPS